MTSLLPVKLLIFLLTEYEGQTGKYWPKIMTIRTKLSEVCKKQTGANISQYSLSKQS